MRNIGRVVRTLVHLKPRQIISQLVFRLPKALDVSREPLERSRPSGQWQFHVLHPQSMFSPDRFRFLAKDGEIGGPEAWNGTDQSKLWIYNLHYFDDLVAIDSASRSAWHHQLILRWIRENPPAMGAGWEPYTLSRRTVNWVIAACAQGGIPSEAYHSLALQGRVLRRKLEYHLLGNHLFVNAKALIFLGAFFRGDEADEWLRTGLKILEQEIDEQILPDGGHFELSPMYHALLLEDLLDLIQIGTLFPGRVDEYQGVWANKVRSMLGWLETMSHPDGQIAFFNDSAWGEARNVAALRLYASRLGIECANPGLGSMILEESGYARLESGNWTAIVDVAEIGASYIPGHGHADTLSFELSCNEYRIVTNGGTSTYEVNATRFKERGTSSHATVEINGENSSEVWASFRVGRRAHPSGIAFSANSHSIEAQHDGYRYLPGKPMHKRRIVIAGEAVKITDNVSGKRVFDAVGRFPLHPLVKIEEHSKRLWHLRTPAGSLIEVCIDGPVELGIEDGFYACEFGVREMRPVLFWRVNGTSDITVNTVFRVI